MNALALWLASLLVWLPVAVAHAGGPTVVVHPFEIYNAPEVAGLAPGLRAMMAGRLAGRGYSVDTPEPFESGPNVWAVRTTITQLGVVYSNDAALEPPEAGGEGLRTYETARSPDAILPALETVSGRLKTALERLAGDGGAQEPQPVAAQPAPALRAAPTMPPAAVAPAARGPLPSTATDLRSALDHHRLGPQLPGAAKSLAVADVDGDGASEILVLVGDEILAFRDDGGEFVRAWGSPTPRGVPPLLLSVGDVDGNGTPEVFVAGMEGTRPSSQALEWFGSALAPKGKHIQAFVRAVSRPGAAPGLFGLVSGMGGALFATGIRSFGWDGTSYVEQGKTPLPESAQTGNLQWVVFDPGAPPYTVISDQSNHLVVYDGAGTRVYTSADRVQGSTTLLRGETTLPGYLDEDLILVQGKVRDWQDPDGDVHLLLPKNDPSFGSSFRRFPAYSNGQVLALRWGTLTLTPYAESPKLPGQIPDIDLGPTPGRPEGKTLYVPLVQTEGSVLNTTVRTRILAYDLPVPAQTR